MTPLAIGKRILVAVRGSRNDLAEEQRSCPGRPSSEQAQDATVVPLVVGCKRFVVKFQWSGKVPAGGKRFYLSRPLSEREQEAVLVPLVIGCKSFLVRLRWSEPSGKAWKGLSSQNRFCQSGEQAQEAAVGPFVIC